MCDGLSRVLGIRLHMNNHFNFATSHFGGKHFANCRGDGAIICGNGLWRCLRGVTETIRAVRLSTQWLLPADGRRWSAQSGRHRSFLPLSIIESKADMCN
jgi:hypothetical protein